MIPSANPTEHKPGDFTWHSGQTWTDQGVLAAVCSGSEARYFHPSRQRDWDWENEMILAQQTANGCVGDQEGDYRSGVMQAEAIGGVPNVRQYEGLLPATVNPSILSLSPNALGSISTVGFRNASAFNFQASSNPHCNGLGAIGVNGYLAGNGYSLYGDPRSNLLGLFNIDHRRLEDVVKRELGTADDFNARIGLNLGGRTYFSADDYAVGRFCKRPRSNSPGVHAPLCQADGCNSNLSIAKHYHRRHKVCELHSKAPSVLIRGRAQRFCQQCSRFHGLSKFDDGKRSCRERLADHNRRRRKQQQSPSTVTSTTDQTTAQNEWEEAVASVNNPKGSPTSIEQPLAITLARPASAMSQEDTRPSTGKISVPSLRPGNSGTKVVDFDVTRSGRSLNANTEKSDVSGRPDVNPQFKI